MPKRGRVSRLKSWRSAVALLLAAVMPPLASAQEAGTQGVFAYEGGAMLAGQPPDVAFFDVVAGFGGEPVTGAPYSAEAETEFVQTLADGNRIVRRSSSSVHRDGQGRTRRELGLALVGPLAASAEKPRRVLIDDPVGGVSWVLDPAARTARRQQRLKVEWTPATGGGDLTAPGPGAMVWSRDVHEEAGELREHVRAKAVFAAGAGAGNVFVASDGERREESLGIRDFSGVAAEGERVVVSIPAGEIGNEQPIEIVTERWYSEELHTVVESVRRDPRVGETRFRLKELRVGEPDPALFEVPEGWTVEQGEGPDTVIIHDQREEPEA